MCIIHFKMLTSLVLGIALSAVVLVNNANADSNEAAKAQAKLAVEQYVANHKPYSMVLSPEGEFIAVFNARVEPWVKAPLNSASAKTIQAVLAPYLSIGLNPRGFAPAATRAEEGEKDDTNYDAIWVRDNIWVYYALKAKTVREGDAKTLLLAMWDYYATAPQQQRFDQIIAQPELAEDAMNLPHIRFDGASEELRDVYENGKPQVWAHGQIDAHGLFFTALGEALHEGFLSGSELTEQRLAVLLKYPLFLNKINFTEFEDAGAWEEISRKNSSSIGLATRSLQVWQGLLYDSSSPVKKLLRTALADAPKELKKSWSKKALRQAIDAGLSTVRSQLQLGGESPDYSAEDVHYRRADAALLHLLTPSPLQGLTLAEKRQIMLYVETLKRPFGVLRYVNDSYQGGNYWIRPPAANGPALTGDTSSREAFMWRLSQLEANTEAQWFFDSLIALAWLHIAEVGND
ncbi:MAG: hypothetical protein ACI93R_004232, partial [Flavobacteriales bacterium]